MEGSCEGLGWGVEGWRGGGVRGWGGEHNGVLHDQGSHIILT